MELFNYISMSFTIMLGVVEPWEEAVAVAELDVLLVFLLKIRAFRNALKFFLPFSSVDILSDVCDSL